MKLINIRKYTALTLFIVMQSGVFGQKTRHAGTVPIIPVKVEWVKNLEGDFSFSHNWSYPFSVYLNEHGQLSCDGLCPPESDLMQDSTGRIYDDSLASFYKLIDTTHQFHTIECVAYCYNSGMVNFMEVYHKNRDTFYAYTLSSGGLYWGLDLLFAGDTCYASIHFGSPAPTGSATYYCNEGWIKIDKRLWKKGIMKAEFSFHFGNPEDPSRPLYWEGKVYSPILEKS